MSQHSLMFLLLNSIEDQLYIKVQIPLARYIYLRPMYIYIGLSISTLDIVLPRLPESCRSVKLLCQLEISI